MFAFDSATDKRLTHDDNKNNKNPKASFMVLLGKFSCHVNFVSDFWKNLNQMDCPPMRLGMRWVGGGWGTVKIHKIKTEFVGHYKTSGQFFVRKFPLPKYEGANS